jgi:hypothetical protein
VSSLRFVVVIVISSRVIEDGDLGSEHEDRTEPGRGQAGGAAGGRLDVFMAGDDAQAKASVSAFIKSLGLRPQDTGDLSMAHWLEGAGLLSLGLGRYGVGDFNFSLGVKFG